MDRVCGGLDIFYLFSEKEALVLLCALCAKSLQSCPTLCDSVDCSPSGSSVHGILQARILELVALPPSPGSSRRLKRMSLLVDCYSVSSSLEKGKTKNLAYLCLHNYQRIFFTKSITLSLPSSVLCDCQRER